MPTTTPNYGLALYNSTTDGTQTFASYRAAQSGVETTSNMYLIDSALFALAFQLSAIQNGNVWVSGLAASANTYVATTVSKLTAYSIGQGMVLNVDSANTGASTLNINSLGVRNLKKINASGSQISLESGDLIVGGFYYFIYDGVSWIWTSPVNFATSANVTTGTDTTKVINPNALSHSNYGSRIVQVLVSDPNGSDLAVGDGQGYFRVSALMNGWNLVGVGANVITVSSSGIPTIAIRNITNSNSDMLSTLLTIDANEHDSSTAATPAVIDTTKDNVATGDEIAIDVDVAGTGTKGLIVELIFQLP